MLSLILLAGPAQASRPASYWSGSTGDFYDATLWNSGLPNAAMDAAIDNKGVATISQDTIGLPPINYVYLGYQQNSEGTLNILAGGVAQFTTVAVGVLNGKGSLNITGGGKLSTFGGPIGADYLGVGVATIDGTGSKWTITGPDMTVGGNGSGTLYLKSGGNMNVGNGTGRVQLANHPVSDGTIYFGDGGASGTLSASEFYNGEGKARVVFNHTNAALNIAAVFTGLKTVNGFLALTQRGSGTTILSGNSSLGGGFETIKVRPEPDPDPTKPDVDKVVEVPAILVEAGRLLVTGSISGVTQDIIEDGTIVGQVENIGKILVKAAGTLGGTGFLRGDTTIEGTLAPGITVGVLKFGGKLDLTATGTVTMELGGHVRGTGYDGLNVADELTYGGTLRIVLVNGFLPTQGEVFDLFQGFTLAKGNFANVVFSSGTYTGTFDPATGDLTVMAVPEPHAAGLTTLGVATLALARRHRASTRIQVTK